MLKIHASVCTCARACSARSLVNSLPPSITVHSAKNSITDRKGFEDPGEDDKRGICGETAPPSGEEARCCGGGGGGANMCTL